MTEYCNHCGCEIHGYLTGRKYVGDEVHCRDCYYEKLGNVIEEHPIGVPIPKITFIEDK